MIFHHPPSVRSSRGSSLFTPHPVFLLVISPVTPFLHGWCLISLEKHECMRSAADRCTWEEFVFTIPCEKKYRCGAQPWKGASIIAWTPHGTLLETGSYDEKRGRHHARSLFSYLWNVSSSFQEHCVPSCNINVTISKQKGQTGRLQLPFTFPPSFTLDLMAFFPCGPDINNPYFYKYKVREQW